MSGVLDAVGRLHPALTHFPIGLALGGMLLETWNTLSRRGASPTGRTLVRLAAGFAVLTAVTGWLHFRPEEYGDRLLAAAGVHRALGIGSLMLLLLTAATGGFGSMPAGPRLWIYRGGYGLAAIAVGTTGHYGGWIVFGWGPIWTP